MQRDRGTEVSDGQRRVVAELGDPDFDGAVGDAVLGAFWEDPDFDPGERAFYYVRVLEIPTPTWIAYDEAVFGKRDAPEEALRESQERAYTSPIWYTPAKTQSGGAKTRRRK